MKISKDEIDDKIEELIQSLNQHLSEFRSKYPTASVDKGVRAWAFTQLARLEILIQNLSKDLTQP